MDRELAEQPQVDLFEDDDRAFALLVPYLPLLRPVTFAGWWLGPVGALPGPWHSPRFEELTHGLLAGLRDHLGRPVATPGILARAEEGANGRLPNRATRLALQRAIDLAVLDGNEPWQPEPSNQGFTTATSDNSELFVWPLDLDGGRVTTTRGALVQDVTGGLRIGPDLRVFAPRELQLPPPRSVDGELLAAAYRVFVGDHDAADPELAGRLGQALTWLARAWRNTESLRHADRIVMLKTGFEALTGTSQTHAQAQWIRARLEVLAEHWVDEEAAEHLLWSPAERPARVFVRRDTGEPVPCTDLEHWYRSFGEARNQIIHGEPEPPVDYRQPDSPYNGPFVWTAERLLREVVRVTLGAFGYKHLWESLLWRAIHRALNSAPVAASANQDDHEANRT
jgi:hypothetical protein